MISPSAPQGMARYLRGAEPAKPASVFLGTANIDAPVIFPEPAGGPPDTANFESSR